VILLQCKSDMEVEHHAFLTSFGSLLHAPVVFIHRQNAVHIRSVLYCYRMFMGHSGKEKDPAMPASNQNLTIKFLVSLLC
jgi:hypothetical protein